MIQIQKLTSIVTGLTLTLRLINFVIVLRKTFDISHLDSDMRLINAQNTRIFTCQLSADCELS